MIGPSAFLADLAFPLIWLLILVAITVVIFRSRNRPQAASGVTTNMKVRGVIAAVVLALGLTYGGFWLARQVQYRFALHNVDSGSVDFVQVGNLRVNKPADVSLLISALRSSQWYVHTASDGGWAQLVELTIRLRSGHEIRYRVGRLLKHEGAIIEFIGQDPESRFTGHFGYAFAGRLPEILDSIGTPLPRAGN